MGKEPWKGLSAIISRIRGRKVVYNAQLRIYGKGAEVFIQQSQLGPKVTYRCDNDEDRKRIDEALKKLEK